MTTIRIAARPKFTTIDRRPINDDRLSFRARGVLIWLLDKPDDWTIKAEAIAMRGAEGRDAIRATLKELQECGYLIAEKYRGDDGKWHSGATLFELPQDSGDNDPTRADFQRWLTNADSQALLLKTENRKLIRGSAAHKDGEPFTDPAGRTFLPGTGWIE